MILARHLNQTEEPCYGYRYYQITAIDEYSRKRVLSVVKEKSTYETGKFL